MDAIALAGLRSNPNVAAFLRVIRVGEGTNDADGYRRLFAGALTDSFADHPRRAVTAKLGGKPITSTAAGAYQFLSRTWDECVKALGLRDFSPASQDLAALFLIRRRKALDDVIAGRIEQAIEKCNREWASLPGSQYGQPTKTMAQALEVYRRYGGLFESVASTPSPEPAESLQAPPDAPQAHSRRTGPPPIDPINAPQGEAMDPITFVAAALPSIIEAVPKLGKLFGSGSDVAKRNVKAATIVADIAKETLGAANEQEVVQRLQDDPAAAPALRQAIEERWYVITEAGGGGIDGARKADAAFAASGRRPWESPAFWVSILLILMPYMLLVDVFYVNPGSYDTPLRTQIVTGVLGIIALVGAFWLGSSYGSLKKTEQQRGEA